MQSMHSVERLKRPRLLIILMSLAELAGGHPALAQNQYSDNQAAAYERSGEWATA